MIRVLIKRRVVLWRNSPRYPLETRYDMRGIGLKRHDRELKADIVRILRRAPKKFERRKGHIVHSAIFPLKGVTSTWW